MLEKEKTSPESGVSRSEWDRFWKSRRRIEEVYSNEKRVIEALLFSFSPAGKRVLEVGAGSGRDSLELARAGGRVFVLDYSLSALSIVRQNSSGSDRIELICADCESLPFRDSAFQALFHQGLLEHFRNPSPILEEQNRVLEPGGIILVDVPQKYHFYTIAKHILMALRLWFVSWETQYTVGELKRLLAANGFIPIHSYGEWMVPGLFYRGLRYLLLRSGVAKLPLYPPRVPIVREISASFRNWMRKKRMSYLTYFVIGVVAKKER